MEANEKKYEDKVAELEKLVAQIESPDKSLVDVAKDVKRAMELLSECRDMLRKSEEEVKSIIEF